MKRLIYILLLFIVPGVKAQGTYSISGTVLRNKVAAIDSFHKRKPVEKLYLHLDKPYYAICDTMRFKAYLLDEALSGSAKSGVMYVELINDSSRVVKRQTILIRNGIAWGDIVIKRSWSPGNYTMRAYTNWMRNLGARHFFIKTISITPNQGQQWLINDHVAIDKDRNVNLQLHFSEFVGKNVGFRELELSVLYGTSSLLKNKTRTDADGNVGISFSIPEKLAGKQLTLLAEDISKEGNRSKITIPIQFNRPENIDLQFMPESGNLIGGIKTRIGFKAIDEDGKGTDISGKIYDNKQQEVAAFKSTHLGMGNFELTPIVGESYTAKIDLPDGTTKSYPLPLVNPAGIALRVATENDSLKITLTAPDSYRDASATATYYLIGQARDKVCYGAKILFNDKTIVKKIAASIFPTGIVKWVVLDAENRPVSQRMTFINHNDLLNISINSDKENYRSRDNVALQLMVTDVNNRPVQGSFSLAVTDDNQVKAPGGDDDNIASYMLLTADLKGNIEEPGYYFNKEHADKETALDNLLLTQGWVAYDWKPVFEPLELPKYEVEIQFTVKGRVSNIFNMPIKNTKVLLTSARPALFMDTITDKLGRFVFSNFPMLDTISFHLQADRRFNVGIDVDEFIPPEVDSLAIPVRPWYMNSDSVLVSYIGNTSLHQTEMAEKFNSGKTKLLKTVTINEKKAPPPAPPPLLQLNEEDIRIARPGKKPLDLLILLEQYIKGGLSINLYVDGQAVSATFPPYFDTPIHWLYEYHTEDIKKFTVRKIGVTLLINVTSNMGRGGPLSGIYGYAYRPMPISWPHKFYSPRYTVKDIPVIKDRRSTIYWEPYIVTDASGKATVSFYAADTSGNYTIIMQGADMDGNLGYKMQKIKVGSQ